MKKQIYQKGGRMANALDVLRVEYKQKNGEEKNVSYLDFLALNPNELSRQERQMQKVLAKLHRLNNGPSPLFKKFTTTPLVIRPTSLLAGNVNAYFDLNNIYFDETAYDFELFSTVVHELKHAEDWSKEMSHLARTDHSKDGLSFHQSKILSETRARACELSALMLDCLDRKVDFEVFQKELKRDDIYEFVQIMMPEIKKRYETALNTGAPLDAQEMQHLATIAIFPQFVESELYQKGYAPTYNVDHKIQPDDRGLQKIPSSWRIPSQYEKLLFQAMKASFENGKPIKFGANKITENLFQKLKIDLSDNTPLYMAVIKGQVDVVEKMIKDGANINQLNHKRRTMWDELVSQLDLELVKPANMRDEQRIARLIETAKVIERNGGLLKQKIPSSVQTLFLKEGVFSRVNRGDKQGNTPLHHAVRTHGDIDPIITAGANVNQGNKAGKTPLHMSMLFPWRVEYINMLAKVGANVNQGDKNGMTPLHLAAISCRNDAIEALVKAGANVNQGDKQGKTPLHFAYITDEINSVEALVKAGANINQGDKYGNTPLHDAVLNMEQPFDILIKMGANVNQGNNVGKTPMGLLVDRLAQELSVPEHRQNGYMISALVERVKILQQNGGVLSKKLPASVKAVFEEEGVFSSEVNAASRLSNCSSPVQQEEKVDTAKTKIKKRIDALEGLRWGK